MPSSTLLRLSHRWWSLSSSRACCGRHGSMAQGHCPSIALPLSFTSPSPSPLPLWLCRAGPAGMSTKTTPNGVSPLIQCPAAVITRYLLSTHQENSSSEHLICRAFTRLYHGKMRAVLFCLHACMSANTAQAQTCVLPVLQQGLRLCCRNLSLSDYVSN